MAANDFFFDEEALDGPPASQEDEAVTLQSECGAEASGASAVVEATGRASDRRVSRTVAFMLFLTGILAGVVVGLLIPVG